MEPRNVNVLNSRAILPSSVMTALLSIPKPRRRRRRGHKVSRIVREGEQTQNHASVMAVLAGSDLLNVDLLSLFPNAAIADVWRPQTRELLSALSDEEDEQEQAPEILSTSSTSTTSTTDTVTIECGVCWAPVKVAPVIPGLSLTTTNNTPVPACGHVICQRCHRRWQRAQRQNFCSQTHPRGGEVRLTCPTCRAVVD